MGSAAVKQPDDYDILRDNLRSKEWRLNNLYWIIDKTGQRVKFRTNVAQVWLFKNLWFMNLILKARQLGFTTFICIWMLDECLFHQDLEAGIIAHTREDASKIFRRKIKYPYDNLPDWLKDALPLSTKSQTELSFGNGSTISVGTSMRSGTLNFLLVSEFGKICARFPEKAREIASGSLETIASGQMAFIESTAEGASGLFYEYCQIAEKLTQTGKPLTKMDYRFFFFPWFMNPEYQMDPGTVLISSTMMDYFSKIEAETGKTITMPQRAWYVKKHERLGIDMKREYPSTPQEAFEQSIEGTYFANEFRAIYNEKRITSVPVQTGALVHTWWDLGMDDATAIWFIQVIGREIHIVDFYEASGEGLPHYKGVLNGKGYLYGKHLAPHDIRVRELGTGQSRIDAALALGIRFEIVPRVENKIDAIEAARRMLSLCWFDEVKCADGITHLEQYRKEWDEHHQRYKSQPLHDEHSDGADAFLTGAWGQSLFYISNRVMAATTDDDSKGFGGHV